MGISRNVLLSIHQGGKNQCGIDLHSWCMIFPPIWPDHRLKVTLHTLHQRSLGCSCTWRHFALLSGRFPDHCIRVHMAEFGKYFGLFFSTKNQWLEQKVNYSTESIPFIGLLSVQHDTYILSFAVLSRPSVWANTHVVERIPTISALTTVLADIPPCRG